VFSTKIEMAIAMTAIHLDQLEVGEVNHHTNSPSLTANQKWGHSLAISATMPALF